MGSGVGTLAMATRSLKESAVMLLVFCGCCLSVLFFVCVVFLCGSFGPVVFVLVFLGLMADPWEDQADRGISTGQLHALPRFHIRPIDVVVYHGSRARPGFEGGFPLRCFQRLSPPHLATRRCGWRHNRSTRGASIPVLSY